MDDQTIARDRLQRRLDRMNPKTGICRQLLDLFYETGTRWTWHTVLGLLAVVPLRLMFILLMGVGFVLFVPVLCAAAVAVSLYDTGEDLAASIAGFAFARYRKVLRARDDLVTRGDTASQAEPGISRRDRT